MKKLNSKTDFLTSEHFNLLLNMLDTLEINYSVLDLSGRHITQNNAMKQHISQGVLDAKHIDLASWHHCQLVMQHGKTQMVEEPFEDKTYLSLKQPIMQQGVCLGLIVLSIDITAQKELAFKNKKVEQMRAIAGTMAHELRTPLCILSLGINTIEKNIPALLQAYRYSVQHNPQQTPLSKHTLIDLEKLPDDLNQCIKACTVFIDMQLKNICEDVPITTHYKPFSLSQALQDAIEQYCFTDEERQRLKLISSDECAETYGEPIAVKHVLWNLFKNAICAMKAAGKGDIHIWTELGQEAHIIHIKDTALGMPKTIRQNIFKPFYTQTHTGHGLGLAYCLRTMQAMEGDIQCDAKEGEYTHFTLIFPAYKKNKSAVTDRQESKNDDPMDGFTHALTLAWAG